MKPHFQDRTWSSCRPSQAPFEASWQLWIGGGSAVEPPYIRSLQREGTRPTQLIIALMEVGTRPTLEVGT